MARYEIVHMAFPVEQYRKLQELRDMLGAKTWREFADRIYEILTSQTLEEACSKICEAKKRPPILEALQ